MTELPEVHVIIDGLGLKFEGNVAFRQAVEMLRIASIPVEKLEQPQEDRRQSIRPVASSLQGYALSELINELEPATSAETIAIIAAWVVETEGLESITRQDVRDRYQEARLSPPGNFTRDFSTAIAKGFVAQIKGDKERFYVTRTGRKLLDRAGE